MAKLSTAVRRELGSVYTPQAIARRMVRACLEQFVSEPVESDTRAHFPDCRLLDPACGDGAFLLEVFDELCWRYQAGLKTSVGARDAPADVATDSARRLAIVRDHIFGVDIDPPAVDALRKALLERIAATGDIFDEAAAVVAANIRHGDSLTGPGLGIPPNGTVPGFVSKSLFAPERPENEPDAASDNSAAPRPIDWRRDFPAAAAAGGFDIIIGNPPYVRERNAKPLFDALAATELGRRWREARMDLWYYFVHRSLDLLRPGGILSFIVNSYWMSSRGAGKMIERLRRETSFEEIILLENARIFKDIAGRHIIFRLHTRGATVPGQCQIVTPAEEYVVSHEELFQPGRLVVARPDPSQSIFQNRTALGEWYDTRQGMAENPPVVNRRLHREFDGRFPVGTGVFVLRHDEVERLNLTPTEQALLRPYYDTQAVGRYRVADQPTQEVLYLSRSTAPTLDGLPAIAAHLEPFRPILERRREVKSGRIAWWHLHWPRDERIFVEQRILCVQMGQRPQFAFAEQPAFVGFSINLILARSPEAFALDVLCGILNSNQASSWFDRHAKRRGVNLEINAHLLQQFPLPARNGDLERTISVLVRSRQRVEDDDLQVSSLEKQLEDCIAGLYGV